MNYQDNFKEIKQSKDKYRISNLLGELNSIEPDVDYLSDLMNLVDKQFFIKTSAIRLLTSFNHPELESFFISKIKSETDKDIICSLLKGFNLNGTERTADFLFDLYKTSRSLDVKSSIVHALQYLYCRNEFKQETKAKLYKLIGNKYPFFQGYWTDLKKAILVEKSQWKIIAIEQLQKNSLNLLFNESDEIDIQINIEKMQSHFIRFVNVTAIFKNYKRSFSKYYTPSEFCLSVNRLFDSILDKNKQMRPDNNIYEIINLIESAMLPALRSVIVENEKLKTLRYEDFIAKEAEYCNLNFTSNSDWVIAHQFTNRIDLIKNNIDQNKYIDYTINKWKLANKESFAIINYLEERKNCH